MLEHYLSDLGDTLEWNLLTRSTFSATSSSSGTGGIPAQVFPTTGSVHAIGISNPSAKSDWFTGGYATYIKNISPSSTSAFVALMGLENIRIPLDQLTLFVVPKIAPGQGFLQVRFPKWHKQVSLEIWRYDGTNLDIFDAIKNPTLIS